MTYNYHRLHHDGAVRLLKLHPAATATDQIECDLEEHGLNDLPSYEAISYVWGTATERIPILCTGRVLNVTQNLAAALQRFRKSTEPRFVWADAICINQADLLERNKQVQLMQKIYENATRVLVWLGPNEETVVAAMHLIDHIFNTACSHWRITPGGIVQYDDVDDFVDFPPHETFPPSGSDQWQPIIKFFSRDWFQRTWIIQEVTAAKEVIVFWGDAEISWQRVGVAATWMQKQLTKSDFGEYQEFESSNVYKAHVLYDTTYLQEQDFLDLLGQLREFLATDAKDKVFAILGLQPFQRLPRPIQPDYSKSKLEVYRSVVETSLSTHQDLSILSFVHHNEFIDGNWPSTVPQWDAAPTAAHLLGRTTDFENSASGELKLNDFGYNLASNSLTLQGLILGTISVVGELMTADHFRGVSVASEDPNHPVKLFWKNHLDSFHNYRKLESANLPVIHLCLTMTAARDTNYQKMDRTFGGDRSKIDKHLADYAAYLHNFDPDSAALRSISEDLNDEDGYTGNSTNFAIAASRVCDDRRLFLFNKDYIGLGPNVMQPGDQLCILFGGQQLYILRPRGDSHQLVGECFVQGLMWGEGLEAYENGLQEAQAFNIH